MSVNRLIGQHSPYLLQHANNPVDWFPWGPEAFEKAKTEDKPVFLSIGYSTCHWCHVMAHESFENQAIADYLNKHFISIKVDREERPDIDHIYMTALQVMGIQGGWPLSMFLTPQAKPFYGGTYFPPEPKWGAPGFLDLLTSICQGWVHNREQVIASSDEITGLLQSGPSSDEVQENVAAELMHKALAQLRSSFDAQYGGFSRSPKFPMGHSLSFLLHAYARSHNEECLHMVLFTLRAMLKGGIYDHIGGGFHRYSTDQYWQVPHFEKMLYDQAFLMMAYAMGYQKTGDLAFARVIQETADYIFREMTSPEGLFYSAQDADSEGKEGAYYVWSAGEIDAILGDHAPLFKTYFHVADNGNVTFDPHGEFTGKNILFRSEDIPGTDDALIQECRAKLLQQRLKREPTHLDDKVLCDWNGMMIGALAYAGSVLGRQDYIRRAQQAADQILNVLYKNGRLMHRFRRGDVAIPGMLDDYAFLTWGLLHLYEASGKSIYLDKAVELGTVMLGVFGDEHGGFFMTEQGADLIARPKEIYDGAAPSGNSMALTVLMKLFFATGESNFQEAAKGAKGCFLHQVSQNPSSFTFFLMGVDSFLNPPVEVKVFGAVENPEDWYNIQKVIYKNYIPGLCIKHQRKSSGWSVQVCRQGVCLAPTVSLEHLQDILR